MHYLPSVIAAATMLHVINGVEPCLRAEYESQLLGILGIDKVSSFSNFSVNFEQENLIVY